jgi:hypothetical protein
LPIYGFSRVLKSAWAHQSRCYTERLDLSIDGARLERPETPWSRRN